MTDYAFRALEGDPTLLTTKAQTYEEIAKAISRSVNTLNSIKSMEGMTSKAIDAVREEAGKVAEDIGKAKDRYAGTASALITYSAHLRLAQDAANVAISNIGDKETAADAASAAKTASNMVLQNLMLVMERDDDGKMTPAKTAGAKAEEAVQAAQAELAAAQAEWHDALDVKNTAADVAIAAILEVVEGSKSKDLNDTLWENFGAKALDLLKVICEIAGVLSLFLGWIPGFGTVLMILGAIGAVIALVESIVKAVNGGSWTDVLFAAVGVVLAVFGPNIGRYLAKIAKGPGVAAAAARQVSPGRALAGVTNTNRGRHLAGYGRRVGQRKLPGAMGEIFGSNPFKVVDRDMGAAWLKFKQNPFSQIDFDNLGNVGEISTAAKVGLTVWNFRTTAGQFETLLNNPFDPNDPRFALKPESVVRDTLNGKMPSLPFLSPVRFNQ